MHNLMFRPENLYKPIYIETADYGELLGWEEEKQGTW
jgi:hypothetical protein